MNDLQLPDGKKTKTGYSTAADVLEKLAPDYPMVADDSGVPAADKAEIHLCGRAWPAISERMEGFIAPSIRRSPPPDGSAVRSRTCRTFRCAWNWDG